MIPFLILSLVFTYSESNVIFTEVSKSVGVNFVHTDGNTGKRFVIEILGGGAAFFDYDNDGWLDIYFVNANRLTPPKLKVQPTNVLYRNMGNGRFTDVTKSAGVGHAGYGVGCSAVDYDNDGDLDLFITNLGPNVLYRNNSDGTFTDVTESANLGCPLVSTGCAFLDYDKDSDLDIYVANYVDWTVKSDRAVYTNGMRVYANPKIYPGVKDVFYRNNGDGTFTDVSEEVGIASSPPNRGLGVVAGDFDSDGCQDIYVANDMGQNYLFRNNGDGTFEEVGLFTGAGFSEHGTPEAGMGTDFGDYDNDGLLDIVVGNFQNETDTLYHNDGDGFFTDVTYMSGVGEATYIYLAWGIVFFDYDNDGYKDIYVANGHIQDNIALFDSVATYKQPNLLFKNLGGNRFENITSSAGPGLAIQKVSRAIALGDYDNDGDIDIIVTNWNGTVDFLRNDRGNKHNWIKVKTVGTKSNRFGVGAKIKVTVHGITQMEDVQTSGGYTSTHDYRIHFGIGTAKMVDSMEINWPSGLVQTVKDIKANQLVIVTEGKDVVTRTLPTVTKNERLK